MWGLLNDDHNDGEYVVDNYGDQVDDDDDFDDNDADDANDVDDGNDDEDDDDDNVWSVRSCNIPVRLLFNRMEEQSVFG